MHIGVIYALLAALLFGASTPFAKTLLGHVAPITLAGLFYLGSGLGLLAWFGLRTIASRGRRHGIERLAAPDIGWLAGAVLAGGIAGPVLLMVGLQRTPASTASLLLNMEGVLTAALAWFVFKENFDRRIFLGMALIVVAGVLLSWDKAPNASLLWGPLAILGACLCWAIDNNLTRNIAASDAVQIAGIKGLSAGIVNLSIAFSLGSPVPAWDSALQAGLIGLCGYGLSLVLFVLALRHLGTARTGAYFSAAPFAGAIISLWMLGDAPTLIFWIAAALMLAGIGLHLTELHAHPHTHAAMSHHHEHAHDAHHQHMHQFAWDDQKPHSHFHRHQPLTHTHPHFPDIHHRHEH